MNDFKTVRELVEEAQRVLRETRMTPEEHWEFLIAHGLIDREGKVLCNRYFPTDAPDAATPIAEPPTTSEKKAG